MHSENVKDIRGELQADAEAAGIAVNSAGLRVKRLLDVIFAAIGLVIAAPILLVVAVMIRLESHGPAVFVQNRVGRFGRIFRMYKLRTMVKDAEVKGAGLAIEHNDARITRVGKFLRATSIDEWPQFLNILKGDMSFIGPRALPTPYLERWNRRQRLRLLMPQGMSGRSQIMVRNDAPWPERLERDVEYVESWSLIEDARLALQTFGKVFARSGVASSEGSVKEFTEDEKTGQSTAGEEADSG